MLMILDNLTFAKTKLKQTINKQTTMSGANKRGQSGKSAKHYRDVSSGYDSHLREQGRGRPGQYGRREFATVTVVFADGIIQRGSNKDGTTHLVEPCITISGKHVFGQLITNDDNTKSYVGGTPMQTAVVLPLCNDEVVDKLMDAYGDSLVEEPFSYCDKDGVEQSSTQYIFEMKCHNKDERSTTIQDALETYFESTELFFGATLPVPLPDESHEKLSNHLFVSDVSTYDGNEIGVTFKLTMEFIAGPQEPTAFHTYRLDDEAMRQRCVRIVKGALKMYAPAIDDAMLESARLAIETICNTPSRELNPPVVKEDKSDNALNKKFNKINGELTHRQNGLFKMLANITHEQHDKSEKSEKKYWVNDDESSAIKSLLNVFGEDVFPTKVKYTAGGFEAFNEKVNFGILTSTLGTFRNAVADRKFYSRKIDLDERLERIRAVKNALKVLTQNVLPMFMVKMTDTFISYEGEGDQEDEVQKTEVQETEVQEAEVQEKEVQEDEVQQSVGLASV